MSAPIPDDLKQLYQETTTADRLLKMNPRSHIPVLIERIGRVEDENAALKEQLAEARKAAEIVKLALWNVVEAHEDVFCAPGAYDHVKKCVKHEIELATAMLTPPPQEPA